MGVSARESIYAGGDKNKLCNILNNKIARRFCLGDNAFK